MTDINLVSKDIAMETKTQGVKLTKVEVNIQETKTNMEQGNEQLEVKIERDKSNNKCLIGCVAITFACIVIILVLGF